MKIKKMNKIIRFITGKSVVGITLAPFGIYLNEKHLNNKKTINHEKIHWKQQIEMLIIFFYLWYGVEWFLKYLIKQPDGAYRSLSFEREAYDNENNINYLENRKNYMWINRIFK